MRARYQEVGRPLDRLIVGDKGRADWASSGWWALEPHLPPDSARDEDALAAHRYATLVLRTPHPIKVACAYRVGLVRWSGPMGFVVKLSHGGDLRDALGP